MQDDLADSHDRLLRPPPVISNKKKPYSDKLGGAKRCPGVGGGVMGVQRTRVGVGKVGVLKGQVQRILVQRR